MDLDEKRAASAVDGREHTSASRCVVTLGRTDGHIRRGVQCELPDEGAEDVVGEPPRERDAPPSPVLSSANPFLPEPLSFYDLFLSHLAFECVDVALRSFHPVCMCETPPHVSKHGIL